jgi:UDP-galactopyranose mutase
MIFSGMPKAVDYLIIGAGFSGAVMAERLASEAGRTCLVVDRRGHVAGNAYDETDPWGVRLHRYGPHYFRTNSDRIREYLSRFTDWHAAAPKILSWTDGRYWQFPINLNTFEQLLGRPSTSEEMSETLAKWRVTIAEPKNSEEAVLSQVGPALYEKFFKNYTRKQWGREPAELAASVCGRIPVRTNRDDRYRSEKFQALPKDGYTRLIERMLTHRKIEVLLKTDYRDVLPEVTFRRMVYTGPIDAYFDHRFGRLPYRSLRFEREHFAREFYQPAVQVNYPNDHDFTRIVEIKHVTGQRHAETTIVREFPQDYGPEREPYYPIPAPDTQALYRKYAELARLESSVSFVGRLASYRYYDMDQAVGAALSEFDRLKERGLL